MDAEVFQRRRQAVIEQMGEGGVAILAAAPERTRNRDVLYPYRQDSDFLYLTGFAEPEAMLVLAPGFEEGPFVMFCRDRDPERETWDGFRAGPEGAVNRYDADIAFPIGELNECMPELLADRTSVYHTLGENPALDRQLTGWLNTLRARARQGVQAPEQVVSLSPILHEMRLFKSLEEVRAHQRAMDTSAEAHRRAMARVKPGLMEYQLAAELHYIFERDAMEPAYPSIVGGGANGCILHYVERQDELKDGDLVLIDAGAEYQGYCADITRTFPVNGCFSDAQRAVYDVVLAAQRAAIEKAVPGEHFMAPHEAAVRVMTEGLVELGALSGAVDELIEQGAYRPFFMHGTSHWLGMDVHDVGAYKAGGEWRELAPGMLLTVEPGLYFALGSDAPERLQGIGVRIEDDVLVSENGPNVLTEAAPKTVDDIHQVMAG